MDLSKAFDCLPHDILLDKLSAYGMSTDSISLLESYLSNRKQQIKINGILSSWSDIQRCNNRFTTFYYFGRYTISTCCFFYVDIIYNLFNFICCYLFLERCSGGTKSGDFWKTIKPFFSKKGSSGEQKN
jgi:hypothetical protein